LNTDAVGKRNGLRRRKARTRGGVREVKRKAKGRRVSEEGRGIAWKSTELNLDGVCGQRHLLGKLNGILPVKVLEWRYSRYGVRRRT